MSKRPIMMAWAVAAITACKRGSEPRAPELESARSTRVTTESPGALATLDELQESFDEAREAFVWRDFRRSSEALQAAAAFIRIQRQDDESGSEELLERAEWGLDDLAASVAAGMVKSPRQLDVAFATADRAEARHHVRRTTEFLSTGTRSWAGQELTMAADHFDLAAKHARRALVPSVKEAVDDVRQVGDELTRGGEPIPGNIDSVTARFIREVEGLVPRGQAVTK